MAPVDIRDDVLSGIYSVLVRNARQHSQQHDFDPMLVQCWPTICDAGPASNQPWFNASYLLGCVQTSKHKTFVQCWTNVEDVVSTLYKCYTTVLCLLGIAAAQQTWGLTTPNASPIEIHVKCLNSTGRFYFFFPSPLSSAEYHNKALTVNFQKQLR